jgi:hypothetical protein
MSCSTPNRSDRTTVHCFFRLAVLLAIAVIGTVLAPLADAEDAITRAIRLVMEENLAASDAEDMPRLLKTMSREMPNRELFIAETMKEWDAADTSTHLLEIEVLKHSDAPNARTRLPYATVRIVQEMTKSLRVPGSAEASEITRRFGLDQESPVVEFETLWKREGGNWRLVAGVTEPKPSVQQSGDKE